MLRVRVSFRLERYEYPWSRFLAPSVPPTPAALRQPLVGRNHARPTPSAQRRGHSSSRPRSPLIVAATVGRAVRSPHGFRGDTQTRRRPLGLQPPVAAPSRRPRGRAARADRRRAPSTPSLWLLDGSATCPWRLPFGYPAGATGGNATTPPSVGPPRGGGDARGHASTPVCPQRAAPPLVPTCRLDSDAAPRPAKSAGQQRAQAARVGSSPLGPRPTRGLGVATPAPPPPHPWTGMHRTLMAWR